MLPRRGGPILPRMHGPINNPEPALQVELPCLNCGYDLRGFSPDHRCPECGVRPSATGRFALRVPERPGFETVIDAGVTCARCGASLASRRAFDACSKCAKPAWWSLSGPWLTVLEPGTLTRLHHAMTVWIAAVVLDFALAAFVGFILVLLDSGLLDAPSATSSSLRFMLIVARLAALLPAALYVIALLSLSRSVGSLGGGHEGRRVFWIRLLAVASLAQLLCVIPLVTSRVGVAATVLLCLPLFSLPLAQGAGLLACGKLARRAPDPLLESWTPVAAWMVVVQGFLLALASLWLILFAAPIDPPSLAFVLNSQQVGAITGVLMAVIPIIYLAYVLLLLQYREMLYAARLLAENPGEWSSEPARHAAG